MLRVVQWATGTVGSRCLRQVIRHPDLELAGVVVYDGAKAGTDAGVLSGLEPVGVTATTDRIAAREVEADCVLYTPQAADFDDVVALLERGVNVVTTCGDFQAGARPLDASRRQRLLAACERGGASIYATGSSPGFITDALPLALLSLQREVGRIQIEEFANLSRRDSRTLLFDLMGFGQPLGPVHPGRAEYLLTQFGPPLEELAEAAALPVDDWSCHGELAAARETTVITAGELPVGTVAGQRTTLIGNHRGREVIRFVATWFCTTELDADWDLIPTGWRVRLAGDAPLDVSLPFPVTLDEMGETAPAYTANRPVNAVPFVCAAAPGILTTYDLPPITPAGPRPA